jgi:hypothetical protein
VAQKQTGASFLTEPGTATISDVLLVTTLPDSSQLAFSWYSDPTLPSIPLRNCGVGAVQAENDQPQRAAFALLNPDATACVADQFVILPAAVQALVLSDADTPDVETPEPSTILQLGTGLAGMVILLRRKVPSLRRGA